MSKIKLMNYLSVDPTNYTWSLYFFNTKKQSGKVLYVMEKLRFEQTDFVNSYASQLFDSIKDFQLSQIEDVSAYSGDNPKISCIKISHDDDLIRDNCQSFRESFFNTADAQTRGRRTLLKKYKGYVLDGQPNTGSQCTPITFIKLSNPIISLDTKKAVIFKRSSNDNLNIADEEYCRLHLIVDSILIDDFLYNFSLGFETLFNLEHTFSKLKEQSIRTIIDEDFISNSSVFVEHSKSINSRTFLTLSNNRINLLKESAFRKVISENIQIPLTEDGKFNLTTPNESKLLIKYLCYKIFKDSDEGLILEANNVRNVFS